MAHICTTGWKCYECSSLRYDKEEGEYSCFAKQDIAKGNPPYRITKENAESFERKTLYDEIRAALTRYEGMDKDSRELLDDYHDLLVRVVQRL